MSSSGLTISSAGSQIGTMTSSSLRSGFRTFPRAIPTGSGAASTTPFAPEAASSSWMPDTRSWTGTSFTVRDCPIARARLSSGDLRTVGSFGLSSVRSIPTGSREFFVNTALTRALARRASSSSTDSADVPSPIWDCSRGAGVQASDMPPASTMPRSGKPSVAILAMRAELAGFQLDATRVRPSEKYLAARGDAPHPEYRWLRLSLEGGVAAPDAWLDEQQATDACAAVALTQRRKRWRTLRVYLRPSRDT